MKNIFSFLVFILTIQLTFNIKNSDAQWVSLNYNLWNKPIAVIEVSGDTIFAGTPRAGLYYSSNYGSNWTLIPAINPYVLSITVLGNTIYVGAYEGVYRSTDRGLNWTNLGLASNYNYSIALIGNTIYSGTNNGIYFTTNNGTTWIQTTLNNESINSLIVKGNSIIAGASGGVHISTDNGITWTTPFASYVQSLKASGNNIFASTSNGIYISTNNGINWTQVNTNPNAYQLAVSGTNIYFITNSNPGAFYKSTNNGVNWVQIYTPNTYFNRVAVMSNNYFLTGNYGYLSSSDNGVTWLAPQPNSIGAIKQSGSDLYAGATDGVYYSGDGGLHWANKNFAQNVISLLTFNNYIFAGTAGSGIYYTTNSGVNWTQTTINNKVVNALAKKDSYILAGTNTTGAYYSTDNGANWVQSSISSLTVKAFCVVDSTVFAGTFTGGVYRSSDNGMNWTPTSLIYVDIYALTSIGSKLYAGTSGQGVYSTTNSGVNWVQTSLNTNTIISFTNFSSSLFAGTSGSGVYLTNNAGANWSQVNDGMGAIGVGALATCGNYIIAGTGSGLYRRYILEFAPIRGDANLDSLVNVLDVTSIVSYILGTPPVPFSFLASDVNTDLLVNVLDVVGVVNIILHPTDRFFAGKESRDATGIAYLELQNNNLRLHNTIRVAGIQFRLSGSGAGAVNFTPSSELTQFQVSSGSASDTSKTFIIYTISDSALASGVHTLGTFSGLHNGITIKDTVMADKDGNGIFTGTGGNENLQAPHEYLLNQNYPNPFNPVTVINFSIPKSGFTSLKVYDITGRLIKILMNENLQAGYYKAVFDAGSLASGIYFYELVSGTYTSSKKMVVLK